MEIWRGPASPSSNWLRVHSNRHQMCRAVRRLSFVTWSQRIDFSDKALFERDFRAREAGGSPPGCVEVSVGQASSELNSVLARVLFGEQVRNTRPSEADVNQTERKASMLRSTRDGRRDLPPLPKLDAPGTENGTGT